MSREQLVHLSGYATIAVVLAMADWSGIAAAVLVLPLVLGTLAYAGVLGMAALIEHARGLVPERDLEDGPRPAADGGQEQESAGDTGGDRNRQTN